MSSTVWFIVAICGFSLSALLLIIAILMFIKMNIPAIIGDLSGRTASRQIEEIRNRNASGAEKRYKPSAFNLERGKLTDAIDDANNSIHSSAPEEDRSPLGRFTGKGKSGTYALYSETNGTDKLTNETDVLVNSTDVLSNPTDVLSNPTDVPSNPTDVLSNPTDVLSNPTDVLSNPGFKIIKDIVIIHTNEMIS